MNLTDSLQNVLSGVGTLNRYRLDIPSCPSSLDVEDFSGTEGISKIYRYDIIFTSTDRYPDAAWFLRKSATLIMGTGLLESLTEQKKVHGVITDFRRISGSEDQAQYRITLKPFISLLDKQFRTHRFFVNKSVPEVVEQILTEHGLKGWEYEFSLKRTYPKREQINQYQESDLRFIQRLLAEVGIFYFFTLHPDAQTEVIHFGDVQAALIFDKTLPVNSPSGMSDSGTDSVWALNVEHRVVESRVITNDYNHREAQNILMSVPADMTRGEGYDTSYGEVYHYRPRHTERGDKIDPAPETANFWARLDHERFLAEQTRITGKSTDASLLPAQVLTITDSTPPVLPAPLQEPVLLTQLLFTGSRKSALQVMLSAVPYSEIVCWRPPLLTRPKITGTMTARVTSAKEGDIYAWQDASGMYRVKFDADRDDKNPGQESMPVRLAKPYSGDAYGFHFPLIQGTEVAIAFEEGDPDRPYIAHALHDSRHVDHVTDKNGTRNVIRTPANNKLRMEDKRGEEHIKLSTEYGGKTQLNLGHNVDASRELRGEGAELRTDDWISIRGGKGIFISADMQPQAQGKMLDMDEAIRQLEQALSLARSMAKAATAANATQGDISCQQRLNASLTDLTAPGMLLHAPDGIGMVSARALRIASGSESVGIMSGDNTDITAGQSFTVVAEGAVSLLSRNQGMQLLAAKGRVNIQAQSDDLSMSSQQNLDIQSSEGKVTVSANQELILACGGAYIKLSGGNIELGCPGQILLKSTNMQKMGPTSLDIASVEMPRGFGGGFILTDEAGVPQPSTPYRLTTAEGDILQGITDENGKTAPVNTSIPSVVKVEFGKVKIHGETE
ncbi:type VI secretion system Vgr family protein [Escherichia coli]|jgi:type VI secretion system secreted protein VgrG|uniref:Type VI secretion system tip protein VgrG n=6 Tax=Enterobacteriaceae TaxID=543 RepID=B7LG62_ECO55|nr:MULTISPECIES: type VI secretion system Vgr family protein [Enterobacteriaceae]6SJL_A Chain A, Putative type VI secretion protein [Escherichia coli]6SJL_B Chain B, Putative type VI secretion protein [Escherichia coli]6SJL_C Chain C, Putative type VI secretion protein [Escherichia coli]6SK0_A Chain A, Putative type VI secretion protein [Escherichia coli]6SK0_B Chain B, Putative type VI secretion protein [Escherichia coli]6SK0_C Chain C, Putative type VI secretion protein [Escherichia coli]6